MYNSIHGIIYLTVNNKVMMIVADDFRPTLMAFVPDIIICSKEIKQKVIDMFLDKLKTQLKILTI